MHILKSVLNFRKIRYCSTLGDFRIKKKLVYVDNASDDGPKL